MAEKKLKPEKQAGKQSIAGLAILGFAAMAGSFGVAYLTPFAPSQAPELCSVEDQGEAASKGVVNKELVYVPLPEILTTIGSEPATRYLKMTVNVATTKDGASLVDESKLVIMDAFINYLRSIELSDFEDPAFYGHMRQQLAHRSEIILGSAISDSVLITEFLLR